jgi:hypothetical protein
MLVVIAFSPVGTECGVSGLVVFPVFACRLPLGFWLILIFQRRVIYCCGGQM